MYNLFKTLEDQKVSLAYFGVFSDEITSLLISFSEGHISRNKELRKLAKKVPLLIAESFQNIVRHGILEKESIPEIKSSKDFFQISIVDDRIVITSVNVIEKENVADIDKQIGYLNLLDSKELKALYLETLEHGPVSDKGGAGLGLIQMVRKSGLPLKKMTTSLSDAYALLLLGIELPIMKELTENKIEISLTNDLYHKYVNDDILLIYKGDFSSSSNINLIEMFHSNVSSTGEINPNRIKNIIAIIEVLQNVSKHGKVINGIREGIFVIKNYKSELHIECSNFVGKKEYDFLNKFLEKIKSYSPTELEKLYKEKLKNSYLSYDGNADLGLYEIARITDNKFSFHFEETPEKEFFFTLKLKAI